MKDSWLKKLSVLLHSKLFVWGLLGLIVAGMIAMVLYAWFGFAPNGGFPVPEPAQTPMQAPHR